ncbi:hypothetical protein H8D85_00725 [bacterium]|nr:hypothetical protein [bacterium]
MPKRRWSKDKIITDILNLETNNRYSTFVKKTNGALWKAAQRYFGSWKAAVEEATSENYETIVKWGPRVPHNTTSIIKLCSIPSCDQPHHAKGVCQVHYNQQKYKERDITI